MQRRARQMRDRGLQRIEAVVELQERMPPESDDDHLVLEGQPASSNSVLGYPQVSFER
jgi:hypothetical protein